MDDKISYDGSNIENDNEMIDKPIELIRHDANVEQYLALNNFIKS